MSKRKNLENHLVRQMEANNGLLNVDLEYASFELRQQLNYMELHGVVVPCNNTSRVTTYRLKAFDSGTDKVDELLKSPVDPLRFRGVEKNFEQKDFNCQ